ncbi:MAG: hypothetical protein PHH11_01280 [Methylomonas sp.]|nr:hypothetical protein [Methylomonas sp.]
MKNDVETKKIAEFEPEKQEFKVEALLAYCMAQNIPVLPGGIVCAKNAARLVGVSGKTLANKRSTGDSNDIPFYKQFGRVWYHIADLAQVFDKKYVSTAQAQADRRNPKEK